VIPSRCAVGFKCIKKGKNKNSVYSCLNFSLRQKEEARGAKGRRRRRGGKASNPSPSRSLRSDDASLYSTYKKPSSLGRAGIQTVVHFRIRRYKIKPTLLTAPIRKHFHDRKAVKIEPDWLCKQSERERGASWAQSLCLLFSNRLGRDPSTPAVQGGVDTRNCINHIC